MSYNLEKVYIIDFESNGLVEEATKIWTMGIGWKNKEGNWVVKSTTNYDDMRKVLGNPENTVVCHNIVRFDVPLYEKIIGEKVQANIVDSLGLSWYLYPERGQQEHGLAVYGVEFGVLKTKVEDKQWIGLDSNKLDIIKYYEGLNK